jgi:hypothetical protein
LVETHTGKTSSLWPVGCITDQFPTKGTPTTSLRLARQVSTSHDKSLPRTRSPAPTGTWAQTHSASATTDARGGTIPHVAQVQQLIGMQATRSNKGLNVGPIGCAAITSPSSPTLPHASSARGTRAPSTMCTNLDLGLGVAS